METRTFIKKRAFTLIEVTVALTAFLIFIAIILRSFINLVGLQIEANRYRKVYSELNEIMTVVTGDMRDYTIDYNCVETPLCADDKTIAFYGNGGLTRSLVRKTEDNKILYAKVNRLNLRQSFPVPEFTEMQSDSLIFDYIDFDLFPEKSPYNQDIPVDELTLAQPVLTIRASVRPRNYPKRDPIYFQTSVVSRQYNLKSY